MTFFQLYGSHPKDFVNPSAPAARQREGEATSEGASYRPFDASMPWLRVDTRERTRLAHTK